jgi:hypothetical protein
MEPLPPASPGAANIPRGVAAAFSTGPAPAVEPAQARSDAHPLKRWLLGTRPSIRRAHATEQGGAGVHLVKVTLRHATVATTNKYLHARPDDSSALHLGL